MFLCIIPGSIARIHHTWLDVQDFYLGISSQMTLSSSFHTHHVLFGAT